jgi:LDH2 family malate/lactate/ureidoglycolate dehydrogenase
VAGYPGTETDRRISSEELQTTVSEIFRCCGMPPSSANLLAATLVIADLRGVHSHGVLRVPDYVHKLREGGVDPRGEPRTIRDDDGAALVVDGANSMGQIGGTFAMRQAIERARETGIAAATVSRSNHCGAMAYYAMMALPEEMIGLATTNALPTMAPWGGADKILGINPLAVAIPAGEEFPIVLDLAFSGSSHGKLRVYHQKGLPIPSDWAFDSEGQPTTNTTEALRGLLQPIGGYKGTGLALVMGILSTLLSGASYGTELGNMADGPKAGHDGHFFMALKVGAFEEPQRFRQRMDQIIWQIRNSRLAPGVDRIFPPGHLEAETEQRYRREGIPLNSATVQGVIQAAAQVGADPSAIQGEDDAAIRP